MTTTQQVWAGVVLVLALIAGAFFLGRWTMHSEDMVEFAAAQPPPHSPPPTPAKPDTVQATPLIIHQIVKDTMALHRADSLQQAIRNILYDTTEVYAIIDTLVEPWAQVDTFQHPWVFGKILTDIEPIIKRAFPKLVIDSVYVPPAVHITDTYFNWAWLAASALLGALIAVLIK